MLRNMKTNFFGVADVCASGPKSLVLIPLPAPPLRPDRRVNSWGRTGTGDSWRAKLNQVPRGWRPSAGTELFHELKRGKARFFSSCGFARFSLW